MREDSSEATVPHYATGNENVSSESVSGCNPRQRKLRAEMYEKEWSSQSARPVHGSGGVVGSGV